MTESKPIYRRLFVPIIAIFILVVLCLQTGRLYGKYKSYHEKEANLKTELATQEEKRQDLEDYEAYTKSDEYVENTAKSKLGLVYDNEIIFKEK